MTDKDDDYQIEIDENGNEVKYRQCGKARIIHATLEEGRGFIIGLGSFPSRPKPRKRQPTGRLPHQTPWIDE